MFLLFKDWGDYKLTFAMTLVTQCSLLHLRGKNSFLDKINDKLTCTGSLKPSVGWGWAVSLFTRTKSRWNVPRSTCSIFLTYAWVQCLSFVGYMCVWRSVNIELTEKRQRLWLKHVCVISQTTNVCGYLSADITCSKMRSFQRTKLEENCELRGTNNVQG